MRRWNAFATWEPERRVALTSLGFQKNRFDLSILQCVVRRVSRDWIQPEEAQLDEVQPVFVTRKRNVTGDVHAVPYVDVKRLKCLDEDLIAARGGNCGVKANILLDSQLSCSIDVI